MGRSDDSHLNPTEERGDTPARAGSEDLALAGIVKSFGGVEALRGATLMCRRGQVHGLVGENGAGKSTLVKILAGAITADAGEIFLDGEHLRLRTPKDGRKARIGTVFQELSLIPDLSVATNLFYGIEPRVIAGRVGVRARREAARKALARFGFLRIDPDRTVRELRLAERQIVEIVKVLIREPQVLVLDEATSALPPEEVQWLFTTVRSFAERGGIVIFISHRLAEIQDICDHVTVFRGGLDVGHGATAVMPESQLVELMLGRKVERVYPPPVARGSEGAQGEICELEHFGSPPALHDVSMTVGRGEIVGIGGLQGQGQADLFLALYGVRRSTGSLTVNGKRLHLRNPAHAMRSGIALVPEDRASEGLCLPLAIRDNIALGNLEEISRLGFIEPRKEEQLVNGVIKALQIKLRHPRQEAASLSGGNQQKVLLGRVLARNPSLLLMYDATRGVDVGTKAEIYRLMREQCKNGVGILFYSTDASELANMSDRVLVLHDGTVRAHLTGSEISEENIIAAAVGGGAHGVA